MTEKATRGDLSAMSRSELEGPETPRLPIDDDHFWRLVATELIVSELETNGFDAVGEALEVGFGRIESGEVDETFVQSEVAARALVRELEERAVKAGVISVATQGRRRDARV